MKTLFEIQTMELNKNLPKRKRAHYFWVYILLGVIVGYVMAERDFCNNQGKDYDWEYGNCKE